MTSDALPIAALSPNVWVLAVARLLGGFVFGNTGVMLAMLADVTPRKRLGLAIGIAGAGFPLGSSVGPYLGGQIVQHQGIRTLLLLDAALSVLVGIILTLAIRPELRASAGQTAGKLLRAALRDIFRTPAVVRLFGLYFAAMFGIQLIAPFVSIRLQHLDTGDPKLLPSLVGATFTGAGIAMAVTTPLWGRLGDLLGRARVLPICLAAVTLGLLAEWAAPALLPFQFAYIAVGLFQGGIGTSVIALLALLAPIERRASILNFSLLPTQLSWFLAPLTGAALASVALTLPFLAGAIIVSLALLLSLFLLPRLLADATSR